MLSTALGYKKVTICYFQMSQMQSYQTYPPTLIATCFSIQLHLTTEAHSIYSLSYYPPPETPTND
jgi:hypothetical protein